jgi:hypothetical protein
VKSAHVYLFILSAIVIISGCGGAENITKPHPYYSPGGIDYTPYKLVQYSNANEDWDGPAIYNLLQYEFKRAHIKLRDVDFDEGESYYSSYYNGANAIWEGDFRASAPSSGSTSNPCPCSANQYDDDVYRDLVEDNCWLLRRIRDIVLAFPNHPCSAS